MADNRKRFRLRRLASGGHSPLLAPVIGASMLVGAMLPGHAEDAGLKNGAASLAAGKYDTAVRQLSTTVNSDDASPAEAARALYLRGIAYRKVGQPGRAIADLGAALWLGLPSSDRVRALVNRGLAYRAAGLGTQAEAELSLARRSGSNSDVEKLIAQDGGAGVGTEQIAAFATDTDRGSSSSSSGGFLSNFGLGGGSSEPPPAPASAPAQQPAATAPTRTADASPGSWDTTVSEGAASESAGSSDSSGGNRLTRWWGSVTDSSTSAPPPPADQPAPARQTTVAAAPPAPTAAQAPTSGWGATTQADGAPAASTQEKSGGTWSRIFSRSAEAEPSPAPAQAPASASSGGGYRLQFAASQSAAEANALWKKVSSQNGQLAGKQPEVKKNEMGGFGTFYSLTVGPFASKQETLKVCNALKRSGVDCFLEGSEGG